MQNITSKILFVLIILVIAMFAYKIIQTPSMKPVVATISQDKEVNDLTEEEVRVKSIIKKYLMESPEVIIESIEGLQKKKTMESESKINNYIKDKKSDIEDSASSPFLGNNEGDVIIVAFYDYNCSYCRKGDAVLNQIIEGDKNVKVILRPLPVLGDASDYLSKIILAVYKINPLKFLVIHNGIIEMNPITKEAVEDLLTKNNLNVTEIEEIADSQTVKDLIKKNVEIAKNLRIQGVPAYVINGRLIPGLMDIGQLQKMIKDIRDNR